MVSLFFPGIMNSQNWGRFRRVNWRQRSAEDAQDQRMSYSIKRVGADFRYMGFLGPCAWFRKRDLHLEQVRSPSTLPRRSALPPFGPWAPVSLRRLLLA